MNKSYRKICKKCGGRRTKKDGKMRGRQRYKCHECKYVRIWKRRGKGKIDKEKMYKERAVHKQTYKELWEKYGIDKRTVQKYLDESEKYVAKIGKQKEIVLIIDTTYFGEIWLMVFKAKESKEILHYRIVRYETNEEYRRWVEEIKKEWWKIRTIVCDGRRWLLWWFWKIPTQMCHFHQAQIIRRRITKNPKLEANKELKKIVSWMSRTDKECFKMELERRHREYKEFLNEKWVNKEWKKYYIHRRTRSAYFSLKRNLEYLFVYLDYMWKVDIPNTTNWLEGMFGQLKYKVTLHRWLRKDRKLRLILYLLHSR